MLNGEGPLDLLMDQEEQVIDKESNFYLQDANNDYVQPSDDDPFYLANRTFYTTCHKISRQNSPSYRKRPPYTFLENWFIHLVFSKSQQILLRFPVIQPRVMMTEGDFIYTPHQMATTTHSDQFDQQQQQQQQQHHYQQQHHHYDYDYEEEEDDEEEDYDYDDTFIIGDEGVMVMSASAPDASQLMMMDDTNDMSVVMDENMWMGHSRYNQNGPSLHVVNSSPLDDDEDREEPDPMYHNHQLNTNNPYRSIISSSPYNLQLQVVKEEDEEEEDEDEEEEDEEEGEEEEGYQEDDEDEEDVYEKEEKGDMVNTKENKEKAIVHEQRQQQQYNQKHSEPYESESDEMSDDEGVEAEDEEEDEGEESVPTHCSLSISPELIDWYRSGDLRPVKSTSDLLQQLGCENPHQPEFKVRTQSSRSSSSSNSSTHSSSNSTCSISSSNHYHHHHHHHHHHHQRTDLRTDEVVVVEKNPRHSSDSYQSLADMIPDTSYGTLLPMYRKPSAASQQSRPILNTSISFVNSVLVAVDMAQNYAEDGQGGVSGFISCMFNICKVFFLGAEGFFVKNTSLV